jgi:hypothetical protein
MEEQRPDEAGKALTGVILSLQANVQNRAGRGPLIFLPIEKHRSVKNRHINREDAHAPASGIRWNRSHV